MFDIKIDGIEAVQELFDKTIKKIKDLESKKQIPIIELFSSSFMKKYTKYNSFENFIQASNLIPLGTKIITNEIFEAIPDKELDDYIKASTIFKSWSEMLQAATHEYIKKQLGL